MSFKKLIKVTILGNGNWAFAIAKLISKNISPLPKFYNKIFVYVYEENYDGRNLCEIINETHENPKYFPGHKIPNNIIAVQDLEESVKIADIIIFTIPIEFLRLVCYTLIGKVKSTAIALSMIKELCHGKSGIWLASNYITRQLKIPCSVLSIASYPSDIANGKFCEATLGCKDTKKHLQWLTTILENTNFRLNIEDDVEIVEVCSVLKNIIALGVGFVDGLSMGHTTKAAVIRLGIAEMMKFIDLFYMRGKTSIFLQSCAISNLIVSSYGGRNRRLGEAFTKFQKPIRQIEEELFNGQRLEGPFVAKEVYQILKDRGVDEKFPLFTDIYKLCKGAKSTTEFFNCFYNTFEQVYTPKHMGKE